MDDKKLIYSAFSKRLFYYRMFISKFIIEQGHVPLNPFMIYDYFLLDTVERDVVREGNNTIVSRCDEVWVFGAISNGVDAEIKLAESKGRTIKYFEIREPHLIVQSSKEKTPYEQGYQPNS